MKITLKYGRHGLDFELNGSATVFRTSKMPAMGDPIARFEECLTRPIGTPSLREIAAGRRRACIVVSDITRPVPNKVLLPPLLEALEDAGLRSDEISLLIATGIHRPPTDEELVEILGEEIIAAYGVLSHDARDDSSIGHTDRD
jgi:nickel-dependent lactate racemase